MKHRNNEFYTSTEYKSTDEYVYYEAEIYQKTIDINPTPDEIGKSGDETQFGNSKKPIEKKAVAKDKEKNKREKFAEAFNKLKSSFSSLGGSVAGSVAVAAAAIIVCVTLFISPPKADSFLFDCGDDFISFTIELSELNSEVDYSILLYNDTQRYSINDLSQGQLSLIRFDNLTPKTDYTLALVGTTKDGKVEEYVTHPVYTLPSSPVFNRFDTSATYNKLLIDYDLSALDSDTKYYIELSHGIRLDITENVGQYIVEYLSPSSSYSLSLAGKYRDKDMVFETVSFETLDLFDGEIKEPAILQAYIEWGENENAITLPFSFEQGANSNYQYGVILKDEESREIGAFYGITPNPTISALAEYEKIQIDYQLVYASGENIIVCDEYSLGVLDISKPSILLSQSKELAGINSYNIPFEISSRLDDLYSVSSLYYTLSYQGSEPYTDGVYEWNTHSKSELYVEIPAEINEFSIYFTLEYTESYGRNTRTVKTDPVTYTTDLEFKLINAYADLSYYGNNEAYLEFGYSAPLGAYVSVTPEGESSIAVENGVYSFTAQGVHNFTYQLLDADGNPLSQIENISFDIGFNQEYSFYAVNPGEVIVTGNEDKTANIYFPVNFESENPDIYYTIELDGYTIKSNEYLAKLENILPFNSGVVYKVIYENNGVKYILTNTTPSGTVDISQKYSVDISESDGIISFYVPNDSSYYEPNSEITVTVNGQVYNVSVNDILSGGSDEYYTVALEYPVDQAVYYADITFCFMACNEDYYNELVAKFGDEIKGSLYLITTITY